MTDQDRATGAGPATAREVADTIANLCIVPDRDAGGWRVEFRYDGMIALIDAYADRVAAARVAEATKQAREALEACANWALAISTEGHATEGVYDRAEDIHAVASRALAALAAGEGGQG